MKGWIGGIGPDSERAFAGIAPKQYRIGANFALAVCGQGGEPACLRTDTTGCAEVMIGNPLEAGCSASLTPDGPTVTLSSDPFGLHGVFMAQVGKTFWFASDLHLLRQATGSPAALCRDALHGYLCFSYVPTPATVMEGIEALPAGSTLTLSPLQPKQKPLRRRHCWEEKTPFLRDERAAVEEVRQRLRAVTARQLGAEREVGVFLSGGLDSSLVAALLAEAGAKLHLYTLDFGPPYNTELPHAQAVAAHLGRPLHIVPAGVKQIKNALQETAAALQQPFGDPVTVPLYLLSKAAALQVQIIFNGEFGDQLFGGWANKPMVAAELYGTTDYDRITAYLETFHRFHGLTDWLCTPTMQQAVSEDAGIWIRSALEDGAFTSLLHRLRAANCLLKGAQNIGPRARQLAEGCGLRVRSPFADSELANLTFACPPEWFLQGACEKYLLKKAAEPLLPPDIIWREKRGMGVPVTEWCVGGMRREIARLLHPRRLKQDGLFRPEATQALRKGSALPGEYRARRLGEKLWTLLMFHTWRDVHAV